jgi:hypothetical protein
MTHQRAVGENGETRANRSPDLEFALAECSTQLTDSEIN